MLLLILGFQTFAPQTGHSDIIYLNDGNVLIVDKAWEEGEEIKYQTGKGAVQSLPKSTVESIRKEEPIAPAGGRKWVRADDSGGKAGSDALPFAPSGAPAGSSVSNEVLVRLRDNLKADPADTMAKAQLVQALNAVASLQFAQGDLLSAQGSLEEAISLDTRNTALMSNLAIVYFRMGKYRKTEDLLRSAVEIDGDTQWTYYLLGEACYKQEKISEAIGVWNRALQLGPSEMISKRIESAKRESAVHEGLSVLKSGHFVLSYERKPSNYEVGEQILSALEELYQRLRTELTPHSPETVTVVLYPDQAYFNITRAPRWSGGVFDGKIRVPVKGLNGVTPQLKSALLHELTHSFVIALPGRGTPGWFLEGLAQAQEGLSAAADRKTLARLRRSGALLPLKELHGTFSGFTSDGADLAYLESLSAVEYLSSRFGSGAIRSLLDLAAQNYNFENAFKTAFHLGVFEFEADWERELTN